MAVALFGTAVLVGTPWEPVHALRQQGGSSDSSGSDSGGDSSSDSGSGALVALHGEIVLLLTADVASGVALGAKTHEARIKCAPPSTSLIQFFAS